MSMFDDFVLPETVLLSRVGDREISTVRLNSMGRGYETCVFYDDGSSTVTGRHVTVEEATEHHFAVARHESLHKSVGG